MARNCRITNTKQRDGDVAHNSGHTEPNYFPIDLIHTIYLPTQIYDILERRTNYILVKKCKKWAVQCINKGKNIKFFFYICLLKLQKYVQKIINWSIFIVVDDNVG